MPRMTLEKHPCFNQESRHAHMRIHLPVAPRCNVQCNFCTRKFDCVNESRPGVTSQILQPKQALWYLKRMLEQRPQISVAGIAGPGDPFANPAETMQTLRLVREAYPEMLLCVATNGLGIGPHIETLATLDVSHVSITVNAVDMAIAEKIYGWVRWGKRVLTGREAVERLWQEQQMAITRLAQLGILVKINTVIMAGINDHHALELARTVAALGADIFNPMPLHPNPDAALGSDWVPEALTVQRIKQEAGAFIKVMQHCTRCRADAVGFLGEEESPADFRLREEASRQGQSPSQPPRAHVPRQYVAVASREGLLVNQHLGEAAEIFIFGQNGKGVTLLDKRRAPDPGGGDERWQQLADGLADCRVVLVNGIGPRPRRVLESKGLQVLQVEGMIEEIVRKLLANEPVCAHQVGPRRCGEACQGSGQGCG